MFIQDSVGNFVGEYMMDYGDGVMRSLRHAGGGTFEAYLRGRHIGDFVGSFVRDGHADLFATYSGRFVNTKGVSSPFSLKISYGDPGQEDEAMAGRYAIGGKIAEQPISGEITIDRAQGEVHGNYHYLSMSRSMPRITFSGYINDDGELLSVYEVTEGYGTTGQFKAHITSPSVTGTFINANSGKQYPFAWHLTEATGTSVNQ